MNINVMYVYVIFLLMNKNEIEKKELMFRMEENNKILLLVFNNLILCIDVNCFIYM